jgi:hypothetical protein
MIHEENHVVLLKDMFVKNCNRMSVSSLNKDMFYSLLRPSINDIVASI